VHWGSGENQFLFVVLDELVFRSVCFSFVASGGLLFSTAKKVSKKCRRSSAAGADFPQNVSGDARETMADRVCCVCVAVLRVEIRGKS